MESAVDSNERFFPRRRHIFKAKACRLESKSRIFDFRIVWPRETNVYYVYSTKTQIRGIISNVSIKGRERMYIRGYTVYEVRGGVVTGRNVFTLLYTWVAHGDFSLPSSRMYPTQITLFVLNRINRRNNAVNPRGRLVFTRFRTRA